MGLWEEGSNSYPGGWAKELTRIMEKASRARALSVVAFFSSYI